MLNATLPRVLLAAALLLVAAAAAAQAPVPPLKSRVTDLTGTLTPDQRAAIEAKLATFETKKGSQVAVLIVGTIKPETIEQYSLRVAEQWKLGRKRVDDGALLIVAKEDRKLRIEVGRGLEGAIPDAIAKRIVSDVIVPRFRENDFYGGITAGVDRILRTIEGEPLPPPKKEERSDRGDNWENLLLVGFILVVFVGGILRAVFGRFLGAGIVGAAGGVLGFFLIGATAAVFIALAAFVLNLFLGAARQGSGLGSGWSSGRNWGSGGSWGSGGGWSGGSGGGFSGGGGDFGGGGASGSW
jgi:uncharacterized protein